MLLRPLLLTSISSLPSLFSPPHHTHTRLFYLPPTYLLFFPSFFAWRLALNVHHSAKNKRSELIGLSATALVDPLIRTEKQHYMSEFCFSSSFWVLQLLHTTVTSKVSPPSLPTVLGLRPAAMSIITAHSAFSLLSTERGDCVSEICCFANLAAIMLVLLYLVQDWPGCHTICRPHRAHPVTGRCLIVEIPTLFWDYNNSRNTFISGQVNLEPR